MTDVATSIADRASHADLAFSIDFEGYVEAMQESFAIPAEIPRFEIEPELEANSMRCLELLAAHGVKATFFILGWIGEKYPAIVRRIADEGHEIGSHSYHHLRLSGLDREAARRDIARSKQVLEDVTGKPVHGFRAPDFSLLHHAGTTDDLVEIGFCYDSSLVPTNLHDVYGAGSICPSVHHLSNGLLEFPIPTHRLLGRFAVPVGGGGYFRLFPFWLTQRWLGGCGDPATYLHPYEIGGVFPRQVPMSLLRRVRHTYGNGRLDGKLARLFTSFNAMPVREYLRRHHGLVAAA